MASTQDGSDVGAEKGSTEHVQGETSNFSPAPSNATSSHLTATFQTTDNVLPVTTTPLAPVLGKAKDISASPQSSHVQVKDEASSPSTMNNRQQRPTGPPSLADLCKIGGIDFPTPRCTNFDKHMREEIKYMYMHEYADGLNKLLETQWYTNNGLDRLFANFQLQQQFAGTLELFAKTKTTNFDEFLRLPPCERKLVTELMLLPMKVPNPNPGDTELQTVISRIHVLDCLLTGRVIQASPTSVGGLPQPGMDPRQSHFWRHLGESITQSCLCNPQYGIPSWPNAFENASNALQEMRVVLDGLENRDVLYSMAVLRHLGPRHLQPLARGEPPGVYPHERAQVAVAKKFVEDQASGWGTTQVVQRVAGMVLTGLNHWGLI